MSHGTLNYNSDRIESHLYNPIDQLGYLIHSQMILTLIQTFLLAYRLYGRGRH